jgi:hypothetical protein
MPARLDRHRLGPARDVSALLVAGEIDDVTWLHYDFLNYCRSRGDSEFIAESRRTNVQCNIQILAEQLCRRGGIADPARINHPVFMKQTAGNAYSHFFHLKYKYGPAAASSIANIANG